MGDTENKQVLQKLKVSDIEKCNEDNQDWLIKVCKRRELLIWDLKGKMQCAIRKSEEVFFGNRGTKAPGRNEPGIFQKCREA